VALLVIPKAIGGTVNVTLAWLHLAALEVGRLVGTGLLDQTDPVGEIPILDEAKATTEV